MLRNILLTQAFILILAYCHAQKQPSRLGISPQVGYITNLSGRTYEGPIFGLEGFWQMRDKKFSLQYLRSEEYFTFDTPEEHSNQMNFMVGKVRGKRFFNFHYQAGLGIMWGVQRGREILSPTGGSFFGQEHESENYVSIGVPMRAGVRFLPSRFAGVGVDLFANLNFENPIYGIMAALDIGKLRKPITAKI